MQGHYALVSKATSRVQQILVWDGESFLPEEYLDTNTYSLIDISTTKCTSAKVGDNWDSNLNGFYCDKPTIPGGLDCALNPETCMWELINPPAPDPN